MGSINSNSFNYYVFVDNVQFVYKKYGHRRLSCLPESKYLVLFLEETNIINSEFKCINYKIIKTNINGKPIINDTKIIKHIAFSEINPDSTLINKINEVINNHSILSLHPKQI